MHEDFRRHDEDWGGRIVDNVARDYADRVLPKLFAQIVVDLIRQRFDGRSVDDAFVSLKGFVDGPNGHACFAAGGVGGHHDVLVPRHNGKCVFLPFVGLVREDLGGIAGKVITRPCCNGGGNGGGVVVGGN